MSSLIDRQQAIDAICEAFCYVYCDNCEKELDEDLCGDCHRKYQNWSASRKTVEKVINALPSVQPKISCDGCRYCGRPATDMPCCGCIRKESNDYYNPED